jgi:hypothetical protein
MKLFGKIYNEDYFLVGCDVLYVGRQNDSNVGLKILQHGFLKVNTNGAWL